MAKKKKKQVKEVVVEETKLEKILKNKLFDVALVLLAMGILWYIHGFALSRNLSDDLKVYYYNEENLPHLFDMDSYYYYRKVKEFSNNDINKVVSNRSEDKLQTQVSDRDDSTYTLLLSKITSIMYKIARIFNKNVSLYKVVIFSSPIISLLVCIPSYIFIRRRTNRLGGFFAAVLAGVTNAYFSHWTFGCFDTDVLLYTIPLLYMTTYIECIIEQDKKKSIIWLVLSCISFVLLTLTWDVYGVYYFLTLGIFMVLFVLALFKNKFDFKKIINFPEIKFSFIAIVCFTILALITRKSIDTSIFGALSSVVGSGDGYPNPGEFTSELRKIGLFNPEVSAFAASSGGLVNRLGGLFIYVLFIWGLGVFIGKVIRFLKYKPRVEKPELKPEYILGLTLLLWAFGATISLSGGSRFVKILSIPCNLTVSYLIGYEYSKITNIKTKIPVIILSLAFLIAPILGAHKIAYNMYTSATDALSETAKNIKTLTKEKDVIATWWDYGYFFESEAERRTVADGGTYNGRFVHYLAYAFGTTDELTSVNTFKMLANSGVTLTYIMEDYLGNTKDGNKAIKDALSKPSAEEAKKLLIETYKLSEDQANEVTKYTHPNLDYKVVIVITQSMLRMKTPINHYANYDFDTGKPTQASLDENAVYLKLYETNNDSEYFEHMFRNTDVTGKLSTNVFVIK